MNFFRRHFPLTALTIGFLVWMYGAVSTAIDILDLGWNLGYWVAAGLAFVGLAIGETLRRVLTKMEALNGQQRQLGESIKHADRGNKAFHALRSMERLEIVQSILDSNMFTSNFPRTGMGSEARDFGPEHNWMNEIVDFNERFMKALDKANITKGATDPEVRWQRREISRKVYKDVLEEMRVKLMSSSKVRLDH
jgi:hypothetical protein